MAIVVLGIVVDNAIVVPTDGVAQGVVAGVSAANFRQISIYLA